MKTITVFSKKYGNFEIKLSEKDYSKVKHFPIGVKTESGKTRTLVPYLYNERNKQRQLSSYLFGDKGRVIEYKDSDHFNLTRSNVRIV